MPREAGGQTGKTGRGSNQARASIGVGRVAHAVPDGYTVIFGNWGTHVLNGAIEQRHRASAANAVKRALAVTSATRAASLPDVPAISEFVPGFEALSWFGVVAPRAIPTAIAETLNRQVNAGLADPKIKESIASWGEAVFAVSITESVKFIADQNAKWGTVIRTAGIRAE